NLVGNLNEGFKVAMNGLNKGRTTIAAIGVGLSSRALEEASRYALFRQQFGQVIFDFQGLQFMLSDMATEVECARLLTRESAKLIDEGKGNTKISSMSKLKATDVAMKVTTDAVQILGG